MGACRHCPYCHECFDSHKTYIDHFRRSDGRLRFTSCQNQEKKDATSQNPGAVPGA